MENLNKFIKLLYYSKGCFLSELKNDIRLKTVYVHSQIDLDLEMFLNKLHFRFLDKPI